MNADVTKCPRCTGVGGAHFAYCYVAQLWDRVMGATHPWAPKRATFTLEEVQDMLDTVMPRDEDVLPPPPDEEEWDWAAELAEQREQELGGLPAAENRHIPGPWDEDPPDKAGVLDDTMVAAGAPSDADWLPRGGETIRTDLPDDYLDEAVEQQRLREVAVTIPDTEPNGYCAECGFAEGHDATCSKVGGKGKAKREYNTSGVLEHKRQQREMRENAVVQFVYDRLDKVPGARTLLDDVYAEYQAWATEGERSVMAKLTMRPILDELGATVATGRLPGGRTAGRAPLLVHDYAIKRTEPIIEPSPVAETKPTVRVRITGDRPGGEMHKDLRALIKPLIEDQGWAYHNARSRGGKPRLTSPDGKHTVTMPGTPAMQGRSLTNVRSHLRKAGAKL